ncbi:MAG: hypothetical protein AB4426_27080 [Xenococcaceae cyanobacterium]
MKSNRELEDDLRPEYDFTQIGQGIRGIALRAMVRTLLKAEVHVQ